MAPTHVELARKLLEHEIGPIALDNDELPTLYLAASVGHFNAVKTLLAVSVVAEDGGTPLHEAVAANTKAAEIFYKAGADIKTRKKDGSTVLHTAARSGNLASTKWLLRIDRMLADAIDLNGQTPLYVAISRSKLEIVEELLEAGATTNFRDNLYRTPLHYAVPTERTAIIDMLLSRGADAHIPDCYGKTSFNVIEQNPALHESVGRLLAAPPDALSELRISRISGSVWVWATRLLEGDGCNPNLQIYHQLGHCLMFLGQSKEALVVYEQQILTRSGDAELTHTVTCDNCFGDPIRGTRSVCTTCSNVDLCQDCRIQYDEGLLDIGCSGHDFMVVPGLHFSGRDPSLVNEHKTRMEWLNRIKSSYGVEMKGKEGVSLRTLVTKGKIEIQARMRKMWHTTRGK